MAAKRSNPEFKETERARARANYAGKLEETRKRKREYLKANRDISRRWAQENRDALRAAYARRRAVKLNACPPWADMDAIKAIYAKAKALTEKTGIVHHVDHIIPLQGEMICGLHVHQNLQVLTAFENQSKGNRLRADLTLA